MRAKIVQVNTAPVITAQTRRKARTLRLRVFPVPLGQLEYELAFLQHKVAGRDPEWEHQLSERLAARGKLAACAHPLFEVVPGTIEPWERRRTSRQRDF